MHAYGKSFLLVCDGCHDPRFTISNLERDSNVFQIFLQQNLLIDLCFSVLEIFGQIDQANRYIKIKIQKEHKNLRGSAEATCIGNGIEMHYLRIEIQRAKLLGGVWCIT